MITLSYGYLLPESGDKGSALWTALEGNIQQMNDHAHDGTDSAQIPGSNILSATTDIDHSDWAAYSGPIGHYRQLVTMAAGYVFDANNISIRTSDGKYVYPTIEKNDSTSFYIYSTDNTLDLVAVYGG